jgi:intracellular multiplication protein IcmL
MANEDAVQLVKLRHEFYRDNYRKIMWLLLFCVLIILVLGGGLFYVVSNPPKPQYFATTTDGRISPLVPLDQPNLSTSALLQWANTAAVAAYTYNFVNYRQALQEASEYFTPDGWTAFMDALNVTNNLNALIEKKLIVSAVATGAPVVLQQGLLEGTYAWKVQMPILVTYQSASQFSQQSLVLTLLIVRISTLNSARGVGIAQFVASSGGGVRGNVGPVS